MPWLTTCTNANEIIDDDHDKITTTVFNQTTGITSYKTDTVQLKRFVGMDYTSAMAGAAALHSPANGIWASVHRSNPAGGYEVHVRKLVQGSWGTTP